MAEMLKTAEGKGATQTRTETLTPFKNAPHPTTDQSTLRTKEDHIEAAEVVEAASAEATEAATEVTTKATTTSTMGTSTTSTQHLKHQPRHPLPLNPSPTPKPRKKVQKSRTRSRADRRRRGRFPPTTAQKAKFSSWDL